MVQIKTTLNYGAENGVKILVYGRAGRGKTTLCATCPTPIILSAESGLLALARHNLPYIQINTVTDLREAYAWARDSAEARQFQTICIDSISDIAEVLLASLKNPTGGKKPDGRLIYGDVLAEMAAVIRDFRDLVGKHVYMTAKQERITDAQGVSLFGPAMPGKKLGEAMPYFPDEVFQLDIHPTDNYRFLRCQPDFANDAKDRSGVLEAVEPPDLGQIINKISQRVA